MHLTCDHVILAGDINIDMLKCQALVILFFLKEDVIEPTRHAITTSTLVAVMCISNDVGVVSGDNVDLDYNRNDMLIHCQLDMLNILNQLHTGALGNLTINCLNRTALGSAGMQSRFSMTLRRK